MTEISVYSALDYCRSFKYQIVRKHWPFISHSLYYSNT